ncbi:unnamed protein product [Phytomonas sp. Hart1]|nr:unnamed protein product [Phytomonas sp. Hart1]|eukprot:CCW66251.1 unnamed protein product [Phytomonas sp. isolate Hart1]
MRIFTFETALEILKPVMYLAEFDDTLKLTFWSENSGNSSLLVSTVQVHPYSYTDICFDNSVESMGKEVSTDEKQKLAINSSLFVKSLRCFDEKYPLTFELVEDSSRLLVYQHREDDGCVQVIQICALYELGPQLTVDHSIETMFGIRDVHGFKQMVRTTSAYDEETCALSLDWDEEDTCQLVLRMEMLRVSIRLGELSRRDLSNHALQGMVNCKDLRAFAALCMVDSKVAPKLMIGFSNDDLSLLKFRWTSERGERTVHLFFCNA